MKTEYTIDGCNALITLSGEIDHHTAKQAITAVDDVVDLYLPKRLILDFTGVGFMDSSGLALILGGYKKMSGIDGALILKNVPQQPLKVLTAAGLTRLITIQ